jgi:putative pyruvate formate lyase activating enzyme
LILPENLAGTFETMRYLSSKISTDVFVSIMGQYFPAYQAFKLHHMNRKVSGVEYQQALKFYEENGLHNGWIQEYSDML